MYVQIDKSTRDDIHKNVLVKMMMGSCAHGLDTKDSDQDILYVYYDKNYGRDIFWETNGWQYKADGVDENYQEIRVFIRNVITAKMCGNLEALLGGWEIPDWISNYTHEFLGRLLTRLSELRSYAIAKSYTGYCKKDITSACGILADLRDVVNTDVRTNASQALRKKIVHIMRGINTIEYLLGLDEYVFSNNSRGLKKHKEAYDIKTGETELTWDWVSEWMDIQVGKLGEYRDELNSMLNASEITRRGSCDDLLEVNQLLGYVLNDRNGSDIKYNISDRLNIIETGESFQYM